VQTSIMQQPWQHWPEQQFELEEETTFWRDHNVQGSQVVLVECYG
jgi:hypothetical protein